MTFEYVGIKSCNTSNNTCMKNASLTPWNHAHFFGCDMRSVSKGLLNRYGMPLRKTAHRSHFLEIISRKKSSLGKTA